MDKRKRGILYGLCLGDGGIYLDKSQAKDTARLVIGHGPNQLDYLQYKQQLVTSVLGGKPPALYTYTSFNKRTQKHYTNHQLYKNHEYFRQMHRVLYPSGKKVFTEKVLGYLTDQSLALWFMDDGCGSVSVNKHTKKPSGCMTRIATYCSEEEAELLKNWFSSKYNITPKFDVDKRNNKFSLRFNTQESKDFVPIIYPYMFNPLKYKIEHVDKYSPRVQSTLTDNAEGEDIV